jgi:hypothetical protein
MFTVASKPFKNGVDFYTVGKMELKVGFPNGEQKCKWCPLCITDPLMRSRHKCFETWEIIFDIDSIGKCCPLELTGEVE